MKCYLLSAPFLSELTLSLPGHCSGPLSGMILRTSQELDFHPFISSKYQSLDSFRTSGFTCVKSSHRHAVCWDE